MELKTSTVSATDLKAAKALWRKLEKSVKEATGKGETLDRVEVTRNEHRLLWLHNDFLHGSSHPGITPETHFKVGFRIKAEPTPCPTCSKPSTGDTNCPDSFHQPTE